MCGCYVWGYAWSRLLLSVLEGPCFGQISGGGAVPPVNPPLFTFRNDLH